MVICGRDDAGNCCGKCGLTPVAVIATHARKEITLHNITVLRKQRVKVILVVSEPSEYNFFIPHVDQILKFPNKPLGLKWQQGVNLAVGLADPLIIVGSDDIISRDFVSKSLDYMAQGFEFVGLSSWYIYDKTEDRAYKVRYTRMNEGLPLGAGRVYSGGLLRKIRHHLFIPNRNSGLDDFGYRQALNNTRKIKILSTPELVSIKGSWAQLNPVSKILASKNIEAVEIDKSTLTNFDLCVEFPEVSDMSRI